MTEKITSLEIDHMTTVISKMLDQRIFTAETIAADTIDHASRDLPYSILKIKSHSILQEFALAIERLKDQAEEELDEKKDVFDRDRIKQSIKTMKLLLALTRKQLSIL